MKSVTVKSPPLFKGSPATGFEATLFLSDEVFDYGIPFREVLANLVKDLQASGASAGLDLPPNMDNEDFVTGKLLWEGEEVALYFEHSLGFLTFSAPRREQVERLVEAVLRSTRS